MTVAESQVLSILLPVNGFAVAYAALFRSRHATSIALLIISCLMFAYAYVGFNREAPDYWFLYAPPPWFVSRIVLFSIMLLSLIALCQIWRNIFPLSGTCSLLAIFAGLIIPATLAATGFDLLPKTAVPGRIIVVFSIILTTMLLLALLLATAEPHFAESTKGSIIAVTLMITLCAVISILGFLEVALDIGAVRNMFIPGVIETRASSTTANPNWFACCLAPFFFASLMLALRRANTAAYTLMALTALGLVTSGSRSVIAVLGCSTLIFFATGCASNRSVRINVFHALNVLIGGSTIGLGAGLISAAILGQTAWDRYLTVVTRLITWPVLVFTQTAAFQSLLGRFNLKTLSHAPTSVGANIIDSAYLFLYGANPFALSLLVAFFAVAAYAGLDLWWKKRDENSCLRASMCSFVILSGFIGQVYWAFPVWISLSVILGSALQHPMTAYSFKDLGEALIHKPSATLAARQNQYSSE